MKTIKCEEPIVRNRFVECPNCKTRNLKSKKIIHVGRCRNCRESYKIVTVFVKNPAVTDQRANLTTSTSPSWQTPSDTSLFGKPSGTPSTFSETSFDWNPNRRNGSESKSGQ